MAKSPLFTVLGFVVSSIAAVASAEAQVIPVDITGLPPGAVLEIALVAANMNKTEQTTAAASGDAQLVFDFANLGKAERAPQERLQVFIIECKQPQEVRRVVFVGEGGQVPQECDEQRADTQSGCTCRRSEVVLLLTTSRIRVDFATGTAQAISTSSTFSGGPRYFVQIGGGAEFVNNTEAEASSGQTGFGPPRINRFEKSGWSGTFFVELFPIPWLGLGYGYQSASRVVLDEEFTFINNPDFNFTFDFSFDPKIHTIYGVAQFPPTGRVQIVLQGGVSYFQSDTASIQENRRGTEVLERFERAHSNSGWNPMGAVAVNVWPFERVGVRVRYAYEPLKDTDVADDEGEVDEVYQKIAILGVIRF